MFEDEVHPQEEEEQELRHAGPAQPALPPAPLPVLEQDDREAAQGPAPVTEEGDITARLDPVQWSLGPGLSPAPRMRTAGGGSTLWGPGIVPSQSSTPWRTSPSTPMP